MSQGAMYGDYYQSASNYPLVRITNLSTGHVFYGRTHNHSSMAVASNDPVSTYFEVPSNIETGNSKLEMVANGIPSAPVYITVGSQITITATPPNQTICSQSAPHIVLSSNVEGAIFNWTASELYAIGASAGSGNVIAQTLTSRSTTNGIVTYTVTPSFNGETGEPINVIVTVKPKPNVTATPPKPTIKSGSATQIVLASAIKGTTFSWTVSQTNVTGASAGSGNVIAQTLTATSKQAGQVVYNIIPASNGCDGFPITVTVTVTVNP
jgi:hypothetical protein